VPAYHIAHPLRQNSLGPEPVPHVDHRHRDGFYGHHQTFHAPPEHEVMEPEAAGGLQAEFSGIDRGHQVVAPEGPQLALHAHIVSAGSAAEGVIVVRTRVHGVELGHRADPPPGLPVVRLRLPAALILALEVAGVVARVVAPPTESQLGAPLQPIAEGCATSNQHIAFEAYDFRLQGVLFNVSVFRSIWLVASSS